MGRLRLYAVVRLKRRPARLPPGVERERLRVVRAGSASIVVGDARKALGPTPANLLGFDRVIRRIAAASDAILPARFGVLADSVAALKQEVVDRAFEQALDEVTGRVQMTLHAPARPTRAGPYRSGKDYLESRVPAFAAPAISPARELVGRLVRTERVNVSPTSVAVYHLIDEGDVAAYRQLLRSIRLRISGPFPPYAFVPGIDHAFLPVHDDQKNTSASARRRSSRNAH